MEQAVLAGQEELLNKTEAKTKDVLLIRIQLQLFKFSITIDIFICSNAYNFTILPNYSDIKM